MTTVYHQDFDNLWFYTYDRVNRPGIIIQDNDSEFRDWYAHATDDVITEVCRVYGLDFIMLRNMILKETETNTHTVLIDLVTYREYLESLKK